MSSGDFLLCLGSWIRDQDQLLGEVLALLRVEIWWS